MFEACAVGVAKQDKGEDLKNRTCRTGKHKNVFLFKYIFSQNLVWLFSLNTLRSNIQKYYKNKKKNVPGLACMILSERSLQRNYEFLFFLCLRKAA